MEGWLIELEVVLAKPEWLKHLTRPARGPQKSLQLCFCIIWGVRFRIRSLQLCILEMIQLDPSRPWRSPGPPSSRPPGGPWKRALRGEVGNTRRASWRFFDTSDRGHGQGEAKEQAILFIEED